MQWSKEQNREPRNKLMHIWTINFNEEVKKIIQRKDNLFINGNEKAGQPVAREWNLYPILNPSQKLTWKELKTQS